MLKDAALSAHLICVPGLGCAFCHADPIFEVAVVEDQGWEGRDLGVHSVLSVQHNDRPIVHLQAFEQGDVVGEGDGPSADDGGWQLEWVANQVHLWRSQPLSSQTAVY